MKSLVIQRGISSLVMTGGIGILATALMYGYAMHMKAGKERAEGKLEVMIGQVEKAEEDKQLLNSLINQQTLTMSTMSQAISRNGDLVIELGKQKDIAIAKTQDITNEINQLRAAELHRALEDPFGRGNASSDRIANSVFRIFTKSNTSTDSNAADNGRSGNPSTSR